MNDGWLFEFHGTSTTMGYSMPNPVYNYELYMICNHFFNMNSLFLHKLTFFKFMFWSLQPTSRTPTGTITPGQSGAYKWLFEYIYIYHHHHHVMPPAWISLTLSRHFSLSFIASGRSSGLHPVSSLSCCMYVWDGRLAFARPYVGVHKSTSLMSSSLLLQQCPACLVHLTWIVFAMGGRWPYSWCLVGCCRQDLFNIARNILV